MDQDKYDEVINKIAAIDTRLDNLHENSIDRTYIMGVEQQLTSAVNTINTLSEKIDIHESVTIGSDDLRDLLAMKPMLNRILAEIEKVKSRYPS